jgi:hypothetical protein
MSLIQTTTNHVFSSALSGIGLSFGRDIYRKFGKYKWVIVAIMVVVLCIFMVYTLGIWISRNQKNLFYSVVTKIFSISLLPIFGLISSACFVVIFGFPDAIMKDGVQGSYYFLSISNSLREYYILVFGHIFQPIIDVLNIYYPLTGADKNLYKDLLGLGTKSTYVFLTNFIVLGIFLLGLFKGLSQRNQRKWAWKSEKHNHKFLEANGISEIGENYRDSDYQEYRLENIGGDLIELFPEGIRGKRAYIKFDNHGCFTDWSGMIKQVEKKDFLSGKISKAIKVEENGKPLEKVENDNINLNGDNKSTERSESESNGNEIDSFEKLTSLKKLFDSGVLNESEYNEKKEILLEEL